MEPEPITKSWPPGAPSRWSLMLPGDAPAVRTARAAVEEWLDDAPKRVRDDARSVVTELVSNAERYGRPPILLRVERTPSDWRIDVADAGAQRPRTVAGRASGGWGLRIVDAIAERWGIADDASRVWCRLRRD
jgi:anti-sigma regulatory factor (Ser/Thr protein kinase)